MTNEVNMNNDHFTTTQQQQIYCQNTVPCFFLNYIRRRPSEANICVSKKVKMEKMYKQKCKDKWIRLIEMAQTISEEKFAFI